MNTPQQVIKVISSASLILLMSVSCSEKEPSKVNSKNIDTTIDTTKYSQNEYNCFKCNTEIMNNLKTRYYGESKYSAEEINTFFCAIEPDCKWDKEFFYIDSTAYSRSILIYRGDLYPRMLDMFETHFSKSINAWNNNTKINHKYILSLISEAWVDDTPKATILVKLQKKKSKSQLELDLEKALTTSIISGDSIQKVHNPEHYSYLKKYYKELGLKLY